MKILYSLTQVFLLFSLIWKSFAQEIYSDSTCGNTKITISKNLNIAIAKTDDPAAVVELSPQSLTEVDVNNNAVGDTTGHKLDLTKASYNITKTETTFQGANVTEVTVTGTKLLVDATSIVYTFRILKDKVVKLDFNGVSEERRCGDVFMNYRINNWNFCSETCVEADKTCCLSADGKTKLTGSKLVLSSQIKSLDANVKVQSGNVFVLDDGTFSFSKSTSFNGTSSATVISSTGRTVNLDFAKFAVFASTDVNFKKVFKTDGAVANKEGELDYSFTFKEATLNLQNNYKTDGKSNLNQLLVKFVKLTELDVNGTEINPATHSNNLFKYDDWTLTTAEKTTSLFKNLNWTKTSYTGTHGSMKNKVSLDIYALQKAGVLLSNNKNLSINTGALFVDVNVESWPFCSSTATSPSPSYCKKGDTTESQNGASLNFRFQVDDSQKGFLQPVENATLYKMGNVNFDLSLGSTNSTFKVSRPASNDSSFVDVVFKQTEIVNAKANYGFIILNPISTNSTPTPTPKPTPTPAPVNPNVNVTVDKVGGVIHISLPKLQPAPTPAPKPNTTRRNLAEEASEELLIQLTDVSELNANGVVLSSLNVTGHNYNSFKNFSFDVSEFVGTKVQDMDAQVLTVIANNYLFPNTSIVERVTVFNATGMYKFDNNTSSAVIPGTVKLDFEVNGWNWCTNTTCVVGNVTYSGDNHRLALSYSINGRRELYNTNFPKLYYPDGGVAAALPYELGANSTFYSVTFPRFQKSARYEMVLTSNTIASKWFVGLIIGLVLLAIIAVGVAVWCCYRNKRRSELAEQEDKSNNRV